MNSIEIPAPISVNLKSRTPCKISIRESRTLTEPEREEVRALAKSRIVGEIERKQEDCNSFLPTNISDYLDKLFQRPAYMVLAHANDKLVGLASLGRLQDNSEQEPLFADVIDCLGYDPENAWTADLLCIDKSYEREKLTPKIFKIIGRLIKTGYIICAADKKNTLANLSYKLLGGKTIIHPDYPNENVYLIENGNKPKPVVFRVGDKEFKIP